MMWVVGPLCKPIKFCYKIVYKDIVKKLVSITLGLKESIILFKGNKMFFYRTKLLKLVHIYIIKIF